MSTVFVLKNVKLDEIDTKYGIGLRSSVAEQIPENTTAIADVIDIKPPTQFSFVDESKNTVNCAVSFIDFKLKRPLNSVNCFWCRHKIPNDKAIIGCPIKYIPDILTKSYMSEITKTQYMISESITKSRSKQPLNNEQSIEKNQIYETSGSFCSFNCCLSFIYDNKTNSLYRNSEVLLNKIYSETFPTEDTKIKPAPHWMTLKDYGGFQTIDEFRNGFLNVSYKNQGLFRFVSVGVLYEKKVHLSK